MGEFLAITRTRWRHREHEANFFISIRTQPFAYVRPHIHIRATLPYLLLTLVGAITGDTLSVL